MLYYLVLLLYLQIKIFCTVIPDYSIIKLSRAAVPPHPLNNNTVSLEH